LLLVFSRSIAVRLVAMSAIVMFLALGAALAWAMESATPKVYSGSGEAANQRAGTRDAELLLGRLVLPPGARTSAREPPGGGSTLASPALGVATPDVIDRHAWWIVPGRPQAVLAFIEAHPPVGSRSSVSGSGSLRGVTTSWFLRFQWPPITAVLQERFLTVGLVRLPDDSTGARADAQEVWVIPRSVSERISPSVRVLDVTLARPRTRPSLSMAVTDTAKVSKIASMIDRLPTVQPGAISCPALPVDGPFVTFTFRVTQGGRALAQASEPAWATEPTTACDPMTLTISGRVQTPLLGGASVVQKAEALLGVTLHRPL
jgi:hypothetical protein